MTVRLGDFLSAFASMPRDAEVDFMLMEPGSNREIALHPQATLGTPDRIRFSILFTVVDKK